MSVTIDQVHLMVGDQEKLANKVVKGGEWLFALRFSQKLLGILRLFVLARFLAPQDFGQLGIALAVLTTLEIFATTGFDAALIYKKEEIKEYFNCAWTVNVLRGLTIFLVLALISPWVADYFQEPSLAQLIPVIGIVVIFRSCTNIAIINFSKKFNFHKLYIYHGLGTLVDFVVAVVIAIIYRSVWALVLGLLAGDLARMILSYILDPYRPRFDFDISKSRELFSYGKWVFGSSYIVFFLTQGKDLYVAKVLGTALLGFYQMAYRISNITTTEITSVICQVTFPAFAKMQQDVERLRRSFLKVLQVNALLTFPAASLIFLLANDFTQIFLGTKWLQIVPVLKVLCVHGAANAYNSVFGSIFQGIGRPNVITNGAACQLLLLVIIIHPLSRAYGIFGTALAITISAIIILGYLTKKLAGLLSFGFGDYFKTLVVPFLACLIMVVGLSILVIWERGSNLIWFIVNVLVAVIIYGVAIIWLDRIFHVGLVSLLWELLPKRIRVVCGRVRK